MQRSGLRQVGSSWSYLIVRLTAQVPTTTWAALFCRMPRHPDSPFVRLWRRIWSDPTVHRAPGSSTVRMEAWRQAAFQKHQEPQLEVRALPADRPAGQSTKEKTPKSKVGLDAAFSWKAARRWAWDVRFRLWTCRYQPELCPGPVCREPYDSVTCFSL